MFVIRTVRQLFCIALVGVILAGSSVPMAHAETVTSITTSQTQSEYQRLFRASSDFPPSEGSALANLALLVAVHGFKNNVICTFDMDDVVVVRLPNGNFRASVVATCRSR